MMVNAVGLIKYAAYHTISVLTGVEVVMRLYERENMRSISPEHHHEVGVPLEYLRRKSLINPIRHKRRFCRRLFQIGESNLPCPPIEFYPFRVLVPERSRKISLGVFESGQGCRHVLFLMEINATLILLRKKRRESNRKRNNYK